MMEHVVKNFSEQLKQRQVIKVATIYAVSAWPMIQIADLSVPALGLPDSFMTLLLAIFVAGFPVSLIFSWLFNFTDHGLVWASSNLEQKSTPKSNLQTTIAIVGSLLLVFFLTIAVQLYLDKSSNITVEDRTNTPSPVIPALVKNNQKESIAILPFVAFSDDPSDEFFADGMVEELLNLLAKIPQLQVTARTSSFAYKGVLNKTITQIGQELGVDTILEGSIRKSDVTNKIRVTAQLIKVSTGEHLWSETYDREYQDIFKIQDDIAKAVVTKMKVTLLGSPDPLTMQPETLNVDAMIANGKGQNELSHRTSVSIAKALTLFELAVSFDDQFSRAYVGIADANILLALYGNLAKDISRERAEDALDKALAIDANSGAAYASLGLLQSELNPEQAKVSFNQALELNPNYAMAYMWYGSLMRSEGESEVAQQLFIKAFELDPKSSVAAFNVAWGYYGFGEKELALTLFSQIISNDPYYPGAYNLVASIAFDRGRLNEATEMFERGLEVDPLNKQALKGLIMVNTDMENLKAVQYWFNYADSHDNILSDFDYDFLKVRFLFSQHRKSEAMSLLDSIELTSFPKDLHDKVTSEKLYYQQQYAQTIIVLERLRQAKTKAFSKIGSGQLVAHLAFAYQEVGKSAVANEIIEEYQAFLQSAQAKKNNSPSYFYNMALLKSLQGDVEQALYYFQGATDTGWVTVWQAEQEPIFGLIHQNAQFMQMLGGVKARLATMRARMQVEDKFLMVNRG